VLLEPGRGDLGLGLLVVAVVPGAHAPSLLPGLWEFPSAPGGALPSKPPRRSSAGMTSNDSEAARTTSTPQRHHGGADDR
jgi:hypothetical protein